MKIRILTPASKELHEAYEYYERQLNGLGKKFIESFKSSLDLIQKIPYGWRKISPKTRRINFKGFPYLILYVLDEDEIIITFICHSHRNPKYYKRHIQ